MKHEPTIVEDSFPPVITENETLFERQFHHLLRIPESRGRLMGLRSKVNRIRKKNIITCTESCVNCARYSLDAWMRINPGSSEEEWEGYNISHNPIEFVSGARDQLEQMGYPMHVLEDIIIVTLDDEYFTWLEENKLKESPQNRANYAQGIDEKNATRLFLKNNAHEVLQGYALRIMFSNEKDEPVINSEYTMSSSVYDYLKKFLENIFHTDIFVAPYYVKSEECLAYKDDFYRMAKAYYQDGIKIRMDKYQQQKYAEGEDKFAFLYIPFFIQEKLNSAKFHLSTLFYSEDNCLIPSRIPELISFDKDVPGFTFVGEIDQSIFQKDIPFYSKAVFPSVTKIENVFVEELELYGVHKRFCNHVLESLR